MAIFPLLLVGERRRVRRELVLFLETLSLYLSCGFEMSYGWSQSLNLISQEISPRLRQLLFLVELEPSLSPEPVSVAPSPAGVSEGEPVGLPALLGRLQSSFPLPEMRIWFGVLEELYVSGAPLGEAVQAIVVTLQEAEGRDLETHYRSLPTKLNVVLLIFFLPPVLLLLFVPLVLELVQNTPF